MNATHDLCRDGGFLPGRQVLDRYHITQQTLWRWLNDDAMGFPKPLYLGRYRYWRAAELLSWEKEQENSQPPSYSKKRGNDE